MSGNDWRLQGADVALELSDDGHPVLDVDGTRVELRTELRVEDDDNVLGEQLPTEAERDDNGQTQWFNCWPKNGEKFPMATIVPEVLDDE